MINTDKNFTDMAKAFLLTFVFCFTSPVLAQQVLKPEQAFPVTVSYQTDNVVISHEIKQGYYLYKDKISYASTSQNIQLSQAELPAGKAHVDEFFGSTEIYRDAMIVKIPVNIVEELKNSGAEVMVCYLPVGSQKAAEFYANACLEAKVAMVNCVPVFIASDKKWANKFIQAGVPIIGDDIKSQVGATIVHRVLTRLFNDRGCKISRTYQLNTGGNTDFLNMLEKSRLKSKKISKTESVQSQLDVPLDPKEIHIGPSDYVPWQKDNKVAFIRIEGEGFGGAPINLEMRLSVQDSPNSAGVVIDAIRCVALARERGLAGPLNSASSYYMKTPPVQHRDHIARDLTNEFIMGENIQANKNKIN